MWMAKLKPWITGK